MATTKNTTKKDKDEANVIAETEAVKEVKAEKTSKQDPQIEALLAQIAQLQEQMAELSKPAPVATLSSTADKMITFISLTPGSVMLRGSARRPYEIDGQYKSRTFTETEARIIVSQMGNYLRDGYVWIDDAEFVRDVGLQEAYRNMLNAEQLQTLLDKKPEAVVSAYESVSEGQQKIILDMVTVKVQKGEKVDANILQRLKEISGRDLFDIEVDED